MFVVIAPEAFRAQSDVLDFYNNYYATTSRYIVLEIR